MEGGQQSAAAAAAQDEGVKSFCHILGSFPLFFLFFYFLFLLLFYFCIVCVVRFACTWLCAFLRGPACATTSYILDKHIYNSLSRCLKDAPGTDYILRSPVASCRVLKLQLRLATGNWQDKKLVWQTR